MRKCLTGAFRHLIRQAFRAKMPGMRDIAEDTFLTQVEFEVECEEGTVRDGLDLAG